MSIVDDLTPKKYKPVRLVVEIRPDVTLTIDSITLHSDVDILNVNDRALGRDHPTPQTTTAQKNAFLTWIQTNLAAYEAATGLTRYTE